MQMDETCDNQQAEKHWLPAQHKQDNAYKLKENIKNPDTMALKTSN